MTRELTGHELGMAFTLCFHSRLHAPATNPCPTCRADVVRLVDEGVQPPAPPIERAAPLPSGAGEVAEPWAVYCPSICHVQRCYAKREDADAYCADLNAASRVPDWVVVDSRVICDDVRELNAPLPVVREEDVAIMRLAVEAAEVHGSPVDAEQMKRCLAACEYCATRQRGDK